MTALAAALAGVLLAAAAQRCTPAAHPGEQVPVALNLLVSLDGDSLREEYVRRRLEAFERAHPDMRVHATYVESDTLVFLKDRRHGAGPGAAGPAVAGPGLGQKAYPGQHDLR